MTHFHLIPLFAGILNLLLAAFVIAINPRRRLNQVYLVIGLELACWNLGAFSLSHVATAAGALYRARLTMVGVIFLPTTFYHFARETAGVRQGRWKVRAAYFVSAVFFALDFTPFFVAGIRPLAFGWFSVAGPAFWIFSSGFFPIITCSSIVVLIRAVGTAPESKVRSMKVLVVTTVFLLLGGTHDMLPVLGWDYYPHTQVPIIPWGTLVASCYGLLIAYSVFSDQLLDVRVSFSRHTATVLRFCFLGGITYVLLVATSIVFPETFTDAGLTASLGIMLVSAALTAQYFPKLLGGLADRWEQRILGDRFEYQDKVAAFIDTMPVSDDVQDLLDRAADLLCEAMHLSAVGVSIFGGDTRQGGQSIRPSGNARAWPMILGADSPFLALFRSTGRAQIDCTDAFGDETTKREACALLKSESLEAAFSIAVRPRSPSGLLIVGLSRDGRPPTRLDRDLLQKLCRSLAFQAERIAIIQTGRLREANKAKDQFLASINHEIRNPLNGITGISRMLAGTCSDPRQRFLLSTLQSCTEQLRATMDDVLDFARIESEVVSINDTKADIVDLVKTTCASYDVSGLQVVVAEIPSTSVFLRCDAGKVRQILANYIGNALKYGVPPGGSVAVKVENSSAGHAIVTLTVTSTGPTLGAEEIAALFTPLTRGRRARETNAHGTGLGLALCKKLAEAMGGSVGVRSEGGKTSFWFNARFATATAAASPGSRAPFSASFTGRRALAIDDEPSNRLVLGHYLAELGFSVDWAESGEGALVAIQGRAADVIFMDWFLPDMDGGELLRRIKTARTGPVPPVIVVSAYSTTTKRAECLAAGACAFVSKPIDPNKLAAVLDEIQFGSTLRPSDDDTHEVAIDLSPLIAIKNNADVIDSFLLDMDRARTQVRSTWRDDPRTAALLAHRLKAQMALIRAKDAAGLLDLLEQALSAKWPPDDIERLVENIETDLEHIAGCIRQREAPVH
jgi:signal transduction histidine kinase/CheY-like chemotaxis protein